MLFRIKFISEEVEGFLRELRIDSEATFLDLNKAILDSCGYPDDQMTSFYVCDDEWERRQQITREDVATPGADDEDLFTMADTQLREFIEDRGQKFEFVFDPFSERVFYLDVREVVPKGHLDQPELLRAQGNPPQQIAEFDLPAPTPKAGAAGAKATEVDDAYADDSFYDTEGFDSEDFDPDGFEYTEGNEY